MIRRLPMITGIAVSVAALLWLFGTTIAQSQRVAITPTPDHLLKPAPAQEQAAPSQPSLPVTDLAPRVSERDKATIIVRHADGRRERVLLAPAMIDSFISRLPSADKIDTMIPPQSMMGRVPPQAAPAPGTDARPGNPNAPIGVQPATP